MYEIGAERTLLFQTSFLSLVKQCCFDEWWVCVQLIVLEGMPCEEIKHHLWGLPPPPQNPCGCLNPALHPTRALSSCDQRPTLRNNWLSSARPSVATDRNTPASAHALLLAGLMMYQYITLMVASVSPPVICAENAPCRKARFQCICISI